VGIGTSSPGTILDIAGTTNSLTLARILNTNTGSGTGVGFQLVSQGGSAYLYRTSNAYSATTVQNATVLQDGAGGDIVMWGAAEIARFKSGGSLCLGTTTAVEKLTIAGNALADKFRLNNISAPAVGAGIFAPASLTFAIYTNSAERLRITSTGNVLIGKTSQANGSYIFDVTGTARIDKIVVNSTGADYVFNPHYKILPLVSVEKYIQEHHHLPGIPPATEMKSQGMDLGGQQTLLLQKIEELTLYMIAQDKEIMALKKLVARQPPHRIK